MNLKHVQQLLDAEILSGEAHMEREVNTVFACDLMSDVLSLIEDKTILLTGLVNLQTIRTAEMLDINAVVFVRGKIPDHETLKIAKENNIVILSTKHILFTSCGILYNNGLKGAKLEYK
ncbi:DRTGG domain-containing protein [Alkaliphilus transvaalensis]|uniref:DRTGG domain-containing protein n=1 Tax=Alkaliphilus transvaalensis TaxID=114628 RepID=UPI00047B54E8|nr:DRTGG domain-containing protein [Alkaliphilus transvaalensis]